MAPSVTLVGEHKRGKSDNTDDASLLHMNLRVVRGPLESEKNKVVLGHYNRLAAVNIPLAEYLRWVQDGSEGPAWHVLLENDSSEIVGHSCVIPLRGYQAERQFLAGKSEYSFILEEYRSAKIRGFENLAKPRNAIMVHELFRHCHAEGLGPLLISTSSRRQRSLWLVGCGAVTFPVSECLLILRPWSAAQRTQNLRQWQRLLLGGAGTLQAVARLFANVSWLVPKEIHSVSIGEGLGPEKDERLRFFEDAATLKWRYPEGQYEQFAFEGKKGEYVIAKSGTRDRYLRVCQWKLGPGQPTLQLIARLLEIARKQEALGVRWAVYGNNEAAKNLSRRLRRFGFLCARRMRTLLVFSKEPEFHSADNWDLMDALFTFDP